VVELLDVAALVRDEHRVAAGAGALPPGVPAAKRETRATLAPSRTVVRSGGRLATRRRTYSRERRETVRQTGRSSSCTRLWLTQNWMKVVAGKASTSPALALQTAAICGTRYHSRKRCP